MERCRFNHSFTVRKGMGIDGSECITLAMERLLQHKSSQIF